MFPMWSLSLSLQQKSMEQRAAHLRGKFLRNYHTFFQWFIYVIYVYIWFIIYLFHQINCDIYFQPAKS